MAELFTYFTPCRRCCYRNEFLAIYSLATQCHVKVDERRRFNGFDELNRPPTLRYLSKDVLNTRQVETIGRPNSTTRVGRCTQTRLKRRREIIVELPTRADCDCLSCEEEENSTAGRHNTTTSLRNWLLVNCIFKTRPPPPVSRRRRLSFKVHSTRGGHIRIFDDNHLDGRVDYRSTPGRAYDKSTRYHPNSRHGTVE